jgi:hypothetical protein
MKRMRGISDEGLKVIKVGRVIRVKRFVKSKFKNRRYQGLSRDRGSAGALSATWPSKRERCYV